MNKGMNIVLGGVLGLSRWKFIGIVSLVLGVVLVSSYMGYGFSYGEDWTMVVSALTIGMMDVMLALVLGFVVVLVLSDRVGNALRVTGYVLSVVVLCVLWMFSFSILFYGVSWLPIMVMAIALGISVWLFNRVALVLSGVGRSEFRGELRKRVSFGLIRLVVTMYLMFVVFFFVLHVLWLIQLGVIGLVIGFIVWVWMLFSYGKYVRSA